MNTTQQHPMQTNQSDTDQSNEFAQKRRNRWARGAGVLASTLAAVPLFFLLLMAWGFIALSGGASVGGFGAAAEAGAPWVPFIAAGAALVFVAIDILIGTAVTRAVRRQRA